jgi:hypothetical protein
MKTFILFLLISSAAWADDTINFHFRHSFSLDFSRGARVSYFYSLVNGISTRSLQRPESKLTAYCEFSFYRDVLTEMQRSEVLLEKFVPQGSQWTAQIEDASSFTAGPGQPGPGYFFTTRGIGPVLSMIPNSYGLYAPVTRYISENVFSPYLSCYSGYKKVRSAKDNPDDHLKIDEIIKMVSLDLEVAN